MRIENYMIQANGQLTDAKGFKSLMVSYKNGAAVRLQDLGQVIDDVQNNKVLNRFSDQTIKNQPSIVLAVQPQPDANTVEIVECDQSLNAQPPLSDSAVH